jgi:hypothetical protein
MSRFGFGFIGSIPVDTGSGTASLSGATTRDGTITATFNNDDPDGAASGISYQWIRGAATTIVGATSQNYTLAAADVGTTVKCTISYTDAKGFADSCTTANSATITLPSTTGAFLSTQVTGSNPGANPSFASVGLGTADTNRHIFVGISVTSGGNQPASVSIGGVSATEIVNARTTFGGVRFLSIWYAKVPTGTTGNIDLAGVGAPANVRIGVWSMIGVATVTIYDSDAQSASGTTVLSRTLTALQPNVGAMSIIMASEASSFTSFGGDMAATPDFNQTTTQGVHQTIALASETYTMTCPGSQNKAYSIACVGP